MRGAVVALVLGVVVTAVAPVAAEPLPVRFPEQAPPLGPRTVRASADTVVVSGVDGDVRNISLVFEALGRRGGWIYGLQLGGVAWSDRYVRISEHRSTGLQPTNPILTAAYWVAPSRAPGARFHLGLHLAAMLGITGGIPADSDGAYDYETRPSQIVRFTAVPYTVPDETAGQIGLLARYDDGRVMVQAESAIVGIAGPRSTDSDTPNHGWFAGGVGVRVHDDLALTAHGFVHRGKRRYQPYEHRFAVGGAAHLEIPGGTASLRVDQRLDACYVGGWLSDDDSGTCTRIVIDYARPF